MAWDLATGITRLGATAGTDDLEVEKFMNLAMALAEKYCDRGIIFRQETARFYHVNARTLFLPRYPVENISRMNIHNKAHLHRALGQLIFHSQPIVHDEIEIEYDGGYRYDSIPPDLELALWDIVSILWTTYGSAAAGGGAAVGPTVALGAVKKRTIVGVGSVEYETGGGSSSSGSDTNLSADLSALMPGATQAILELYRRQSA